MARAMLLIGFAAAACDAADQLRGSGPVHNLTTPACPVDQSQRYCNPGDAGQNVSVERVCDCQYGAYCTAECPAPSGADCWICTGGGERLCPGTGFQDWDAAVARAYPGCQPCNKPNGGGLDWKLYAIEDHHC